ncbi:hypothetical protein BpHYR1_001341 [Brachionus plicatilis]|uniref:Uncharacterized protein n=1 Tax=Brachionus plicatilis TaxID=10195 RepID=A0A3M7QAZ2_BRAPC|nr:hypothetical protein BpHYR1_001341 [Brachionus plicatilis]
MNIIKKQLTFKAPQQKTNIIIFCFQSLYKHSLAHCKQLRYNFLDAILKKKTNAQIFIFKKYKIFKFIIRGSRDPGGRGWGRGGVTLVPP